MAASESMVGSSFPVSLSLMSEHDLLEVVEIEQSTGLSQWGWNAYFSELQTENRNLMWVARLDQATKLADRTSVAGYVVGRLGADELHINNLAVRHDFRRHGVASALLVRLLQQARAAGATVAFLEVRASNTAARALYQKHGFSVVGRRRDYYPEPREDALTMSMKWV